MASNASFNPDRYRPVALNGHPDLSEDSVSYREYWDEQIHRCLHGYKPKGMDWISGKYYYYLNFYKILAYGGEELGHRKALLYPSYRDMDAKYFELFDTCKQEQKGMIALKARDKGFSYMNSGLVAHEFTFYPYSETGIAAGLQSTADSFFTKIKRGLLNQDEELRHSWLKNTDEIVKAGYKRKTKDGKWEEGGYQSQIICRTMDNPEVFKGERLSIMVFEEAGEFKRLKNAYMSSKACFMEGRIQFGVPIIGGTGGDIEAASKDFKDMYYSPDAYNLIPMFIPATYCMVGFMGDKGNSLVDLAGNHLKSERKVIQESGDEQAYALHLQNYPLTVEEAFLKSKGSRFNLSLLNSQRGRIMSSKELQGKIQRGSLEWVFDENGKTDNVKFILNPKGDYKVLYHPEPKYAGLDIGGVDSIDQGESGATDSLGSAFIYRRFANADMPHSMPIAEYTCRPETDTVMADDFFEGVLKLAVYYDSKMLIEFTKIGIIDYFVRKKAQRFLKEKPRTAHAPNTKTRNRYGVHMNKQVKQFMETAIDTYIKESVDDIFFMELLDELADYGTRNTDRAIAFGLCLLHNIDNYSIEAKEIDKSNKTNTLPRYKINSQGTPIRI